jgi:hypothetical protein
MKDTAKWWTCIEKSFDRVNNDQAKLAQGISEKRLLKLIRAFLRAADGEWVGESGA